MSLFALKWRDVCCGILSFLSFDELLPLRFVNGFFLKLVSEDSRYIQGMKYVHQVRNTKCISHKDLKPIYHFIREFHALSLLKFTIQTRVYARLVIIHSFCYFYAWNYQPAVVLTKERLKISDVNNFIIQNKLITAIIIIAIKANNLVIFSDLLAMNMYMSINWESAIGRRVGRNGSSQLVSFICTKIHEIQCVLWGAIEAKRISVIQTLKNLCDERKLDINHEHCLTLLFEVDSPELRPLLGIPNNFTHPPSEILGILRMKNAQRKCLLLEKYKNENLENWRAIHYTAAATGNIEWLERGLKYDASECALCAAYHNQIEMLRHILSRHFASINIRDMINLIIFNDQVKMLELLSEYSLTPADWIYGIEISVMSNSEACMDFCNKQIPSIIPISVGK